MNGDHAEREGYTVCRKCGNIFLSIKKIEAGHLLGCKECLTIFFKDFKKEIVDGAKKNEKLFPIGG